MATPGTKGAKKDKGEESRTLTIDCPNCFVQIGHVEVTEEKHGVMDIGGEIKYDLNAKDNGAPRYFCPECQGEIEEVDLMFVPEPAEVGK